MNAHELRLGNYFYIPGLFQKSNVLGIVENISKDEIKLDKVECTVNMLEPIKLDDSWLLKFGFEKIEEKMYINGFKYFKHCDNTLFGDFYKDGTWFDGIGTMQNNGDIVLNVLCRGNYVCDSIQYVHELQNLFFYLTRQELILK